jgi:hypothetical protein
MPATGRSASRHGTPQPGLSPSTPAPVPAKSSRNLTRIFVILMVLTGLLGTILTVTVYFVIDGGLGNLP